jgi:hypothetical protein
MQCGQSGSRHLEFGQNGYCLSTQMFVIITLEWKRQYCGVWSIYFCGCCFGGPLVVLLDSFMTEILSVKHNINTKMLVGKRGTIIPFNKISHA